MLINEKIPKKKSSTTISKPKSIFSSIKLNQTFYSLFEGLLNLVRTWFVIVYHPREFFSYFFNPSCHHIKFDTTVLLGLRKYCIDSKKQSLLGVLKFVYETAVVLVFALTAIIIMLSESSTVADKFDFQNPLVFESDYLELVKDPLLALIATIYIFLCVLFLAIYLRFFL